MVLAYFRTLGEVTFLTLLYWLVGLLPEEYHSSKGSAWARVGAYRWAAWHFRKYLKYSDDSFGRASLAWCYENLGLLEPAIRHYRVAYAKNPRPDYGCCLARAELASGNVAGARVFQAEIARRRDELSPDFAPAFADLEAQLTSVELPTSDVQANIVAPDSAWDADVVNQGPRRVRPLLRALLSSYAAYGVAAFILNARLIAGPYNTPAHVSSLLIFVIVAGAIFCGSLLVTHVPVFLLLQARIDGALTRSRAVFAGAALAPASMAVCLIAFYRPIRGGTVSQWIEFFARSPVEFLLWALPFWIGAGVFAASFTGVRPVEQKEALAATSDDGTNTAAAHVTEERVRRAGEVQGS